MSCQHCRPESIAKRRWRTSLELLHMAGKLGNVLLQFAPWVTPKEADKTFGRIEDPQTRFAPYQLAVEFKNRGWFEDGMLEDVLGFLRRLEVVSVAVDEPQGFANSVPPIVDVFGPNV